MKKTLFLLIFSSFFYSTIRAEEGFIFFNIYKPNQKYVSVMNNNIEMIMDLSNIPGIPEDKKEMKMSMSSKNSFEMRTFSPKENSIPFELEFMDGVSSSSIPNAKNLNPKLKGIKFYGNIYDFYKLNYDSFYFPDMKEDSLIISMKPALIEMSKNISENIKFPTSPLKIGDTFSQIIPLNLPLGQLGNITMVAHSIYKLVSMKDGKAIFDFTIDIKIEGGLDVKDKKLAMKAAGGGTGSSEYDLKLHFTTKQSFNQTINMEMEVGGNTMIQKMNMIGDVTTEIK